MEVVEYVCSRSGMVFHSTGELATYFRWVEDWMDGEMMVVTKHYLVKMDGKTCPLCGNDLKLQSAI